MKVKFTDKISTREGREAEVTEAAGRRLIDGGFAERAGAKAETKSEPKADKPAAKKAPAKKTTAKKAAKKS